MVIEPGDVPRGTRVYLDGREVDQVFFVDIRKGIVRRYRDGLPLDRWRKRVLTETLRGKVAVRIPGEVQDGRC